jgi:hypothetical protein
MAKHGIPKENRQKMAGSIRRLLGERVEIFLGNHLTDNNTPGGPPFEIDKHRLSLRLTAPYSESRRQTASTLAKHRGFHSNNTDDS